jgi:hypothetical protein
VLVLVRLEANLNRGGYGAAFNINKAIYNVALSKSVKRGELEGRHTLGHPLVRN